MTPQEIFDYAAKRLYAQGRPSFNPAYRECMYRGPDGAKCAVGFFIPDSKYERTMEGYFVEDIGQALDPDLIYVGDPSQIATLRNLQFAHDGAARQSYNTGEPFLDCLGEQLTKRAESLGLEFDPEDYR